MAAAAETQPLSADTSAHERLVRSTVRLAGVGVLLCGVGLIPQIATHAARAPWWSAAAAGTVFGSAAAVLLVSYLGSLARLRQTVAALAMSYPSGLVGWLFVRGDDGIPADEGIWLATFPGLVCLATSAVWRFGPIIGYLLVVVPLSHLTEPLLRIDHGYGRWLLECAMRVAYTALFVAAGVAAVRSGRILDETAALARSQAAAAAATEARAAERRRFDALTHDGVMATLLGAARSANTPVLAQQAALTLAQLDLLRSGLAESADFDAPTLRALVTAAADRADDTRVRIVGDVGELVVPGEVGRALAAAVAEAIRNAGRHAGGGATCVVHAEFRPDGVRVDIVDDGSGFEPHAVPPHRLGLRVSVQGRFGELPGTWTRVESAPGAGTRITLGWRRSG